VRVHVHPILFVLILVALQPKPTGTITGRVTFEDSAAPAADVAIQCIARGGSFSERVVTDSEGRYRCTVPPGVYRVRAQLSRLDTLYLSQTYGVKVPGDEGLGIHVRAHARVELPFVLRRSGTIGGRVVDDDGVPLRNAIVSVYPESTENLSPGTHTLERAATIGDGGTFSIGGLPPGVYRIRAEPPERATVPDKDGRRLVPTWYPNAVDPRYAIPVQVNHDDFAGVDLVLARSRMPVVSGLVVRADGSPSAGIQVSLAAGDSRGLSSSVVTTGVKGDFSFESVAPGAYELAARVSGAPAEVANVALVVGESDILGLLLSLRTGTMVSGRVRFEGEGFPSAAISVDVRGVDRFAIGSRTATDARGRFVLPPGIGPRLLRVNGLPKGWWLKSVTAAGRDITNAPIDLGDGLDGVDILVSRRMSTLSGVIEAGDAEKAELPADTAILIFSEDSSQWVNASTAVARVWPTHEGREDDRQDGTFLAEGLPAGAYRVVAVDTTPVGFLQAVPDLLRSLSSRATLVTLGDGEAQQVVIPLVRRE
jgi:protocatechuate 3,4-dioxygenase beta subunit